jgi:hypothetical protein
MARLNLAAPTVTPEQISSLDNQGKPILKNPVFDAISDGASGE